MRVNRSNPLPPSQGSGAQRGISKSDRQMKKFVSSAKKRM